MKSVVIYGPHAEEYSLAKVNRELAIAMDQIINTEGLEYEITITAHPDEVARTPNANDYQNYPGLKAVYEDYDPEKHYDFAIYNNFPKDPNALHGLAKLNASVKIAYIAWEEDRFPKRWVDEFNENLSAVFVTTLHTQRVLQNSGVRLPILLLPIAPAESFFAAISSADEQENYPLQTKKTFRFFHNSTGLERKGARELVKAFTEEFSKDDDVALVIKSFPNMNNEFPSALGKLTKTKSAPEIEYIEKPDLTETELISLYRQCSVYISPSKAEGFNLPVLEAMLLGLPVVTTAWSGQMDFASDETAYLVDYTLEPAKSHLDNPGAFWAEVSVTDLKAKMRLAYTEWKSTSQQDMVRLAAETARNYRWETTAVRMFDYLDYMNELKDSENINFGVVTTHNSVCGIAEYSNYLYGGLEGYFKSFTYIANSDPVGRKKLDRDIVQRLWEYGEADFQRLFEYLDKLPQAQRFDIVHIQYNLNFYTLDGLRLLIKGLVKRKIKVILTAHTVQLPGSELGYIEDALRLLSQIHVLNHADVEYLKGLGLENVMYFPHGNLIHPAQSKGRLRRSLGLSKHTPIIASHGFMIENKGILETLEAVKLLKASYPNIMYLAVNAVNPTNMTSQGLKDRFAQKVSEFDLQDNVIHLDEFLDKEEITTALSAADVVVFAYGESNETASGAIRLAIGVQRPIIATKSNQLADLREVAILAEGNAPPQIVDAIKMLVEDKELYHKHRALAKSYALQNSWETLDLLYLSMIAKI